MIAQPADPFGRYYAEILRAEGLNEFAVTDICDVTAAMLAGYDVVVLGEMSLTPPRSTMLDNWVNGGGNLIAMRPDTQLAGLLGLTDAARHARRTPTCRSTPRAAGRRHRRRRRSSSTAPPTATRSRARATVATLYSRRDHRDGESRR